MALLDRNINLPAEDIPHLMKTYKHFYEKVYSRDNLYLAYRKARERKTKKGYVLKFEENLIPNLLDLQEELRENTYRPAPLKTFILRDPKTRKISVSEFRDRIVHHAVCNIIELIFERSFIPDSYANRKGKGTLAAIKRFDYFKRIVSRNGSCVKNHPQEVRGYMLKADIKHYFESVDHSLLLSILKKKIKDKELLSLISIILKNYLGSFPGKDMPLGNLTSQFLANVYLNELDWFVKQKLKAKYYLRYVDDFVILHRSKAELEKYKKLIGQFLEKYLSLQLHPQKTKIFPLHRGTDFLGVVIFYRHKQIKKKNLIRFNQKYLSLSKRVKDKESNYDELYDFMEGWIAYTKQANTYRLRTKILREFEESFSREISIKEINRAMLKMKKSPRLSSAGKNNFKVPTPADSRTSLLSIQFQK